MNRLSKESDMLDANDIAPTNPIVVTGFGPFGEHKINASWEAVKLLPNFKLSKSYNLIVQEVPVLYKVVDDLVPSLWKKYDPKLVIHVGVSSFTTKITLESCANRKGYMRNDCEGNSHNTGECETDSKADYIYSQLNLNEICDAVNEEGKLKATVSKNAGRYLCEYIFYKSLSIDNKRVLFVHVPPLGKPYTAEQLAEGLIIIIQNALEQLQYEENQIAQA